MEVLKHIPDKHYQLSCVDPPYGIGESRKQRISTSCKRWKSAPNIAHYIPKQWDSVAPDSDYFMELFRVSKHQIIWGGNYFINNLYPSMGWIFWDKQNGETDFSDGELAWTSMNRALRRFAYLWSGFKKQIPEQRFHPTQKPVKLYEWLLKNYAQKGDRILDTHGGSFSLAIACYNLDFSFTGIELDESYFNAAIKRFEEHKKQIRMFDNTDQKEANK